MLFGRMLKEITCRPLGRDAAADEIGAVSFDSRTAGKDTLFVCLRGQAADGHEYAMAAYRAGCRVFIAEHALELPHDAAVYLAPNTRIALAEASAVFFGHPARSLRLVGITGTKGKTTTAVMAAHILNQLGECTGYIGSNGISFCGEQYETKNTTPESYHLHCWLGRMREAGVRTVVMEVSSQALMLHRVHGLPFAVTVFTNLANDHIGPGEHSSFEQYRACKASLFAEYGASTMIWNADDPASEGMLRASTATEHISYGLAEGADLRAWALTHFRDGAALGVRFSVQGFGGAGEATLGMPGECNVSNALAAIAIAHTCLRDTRGEEGLLSSLLETLPQVRVKGRFEVVQALPCCSFVIDYAHNGLSLEAALRVLRAYEPRRLICLFGSVGGRTFERRAQLGRVASTLADFCILTADNPDFEDPAMTIAEIRASFADHACPAVEIPDRAEAIRYAVQMARPGDIVLLAGKGHETYQLIRGERCPFAERELLSEAAAQLLQTPAK